MGLNGQIGVDGQGGSEGKEKPKRNEDKTKN